MRLIYRIALRLGVVLLLLMSLWAALFYYTMVDEIRDEADDSLEDYSSMLITRILAGEQVPQQSGDGSNNSYTIREVDASYAATTSHIRYFDRNVYIPEKREHEPARVLVSIFEDRLGRYYELSVATPTFEKDDLFRAVLGWIVVLYVVLLIIVLAVTMFIFYGSMRPLYRLLAWLDAYRPGCKPSPVPVSSDVVEFSRLGGALQQAVNRSEALFEQQSQFIGNASHELQTPLAIISNRVEWLLDSPSIGVEQAEELHKVQQTLMRAVRLNKTLLLLTKIDNGQFLEVEDVDVVALLRDGVEMYGEIYSSHAMQTRVSLPDSFVVQMNESLASTLLNNLLKNSFVHSQQGSDVEVALRGRTLRISNSGATPLDADHIFERFYQGSRKKGSTGLGLALVAAVCRHYGFALRYYFEDGKHHFEVGF